MTTARDLPVRTADGVDLRAEWCPGTPAARTAVLCCHPHPQFGGTMHAPLIGELFRAVAATGRPVARFDFRGAGRSGGTFADGVGERLDVAATLDALDAAVTAERGVGLPVVAVGWSFGADLALTTDDPRLAARVLVAPPLRWVDRSDRTDDDRPTLVVVGTADDLVGAAGLVARARSWTGTEVVAVPGADHFFADPAPVVAAVTAFLDRLDEPT